MSSSAPLVAPRDFAAWRAWLAANHAASRGVWLVTHKKASGRMELPHRDAVKAALAHGWVDSLPRAVDDARTSVYFSPRRPSSGWSAVNKGLVEELEREGAMAAPGLEAIARAKASGAWSKLDASEALEVPGDLAAALDARGARARWDALPPSLRKGLLQQICLAVRPETRSARVQRVAQDAADGVRAGKKPAGPPKRHGDGAAAGAAAVAGSGPAVATSAQGRRARSPAARAPGGTADASARPASAKRDRRR